MGDSILYDYYPSVLTYRGQRAFSLPFNVLSRTWAWDFSPLTWCNEELRTFKLHWREKIQKEINTEHNNQMHNLVSALSSGKHGCFFVVPLLDCCHVDTTWVASLTPRFIPGCWPPWKSFSERLRLFCDKEGMSCVFFVFCFLPEASFFSTIQECLFHSWNLLHF